MSFCDTFYELIYYLYLLLNMNDYYEYLNYLTYNRMVTITNGKTTIFTKFRRNLKDLATFERDFYANGYFNYQFFTRDSMY